MKRRLNLIFEEDSKNILLIGIFILLFILAISSNDIFVIVFCLLVALYLLIKKAKTLIRLNKILKSITFDELKLIEYELKKSIYTWKYHYTLTNNYIIMQGMNVGILKYADIVLVYEKSTFGNKTINRHLVLVTKENEKFKFIIGSIDFSIYNHYNHFNEFLYLKNHNILFGYNKENIMKIKKKHKIFIKRI